MADQFHSVPRGGGIAAGTDLTSSVESSGDTWLSLFTPPAPSTIFTSGH